MKKSLATALTFLLCAFVLPLLPASGEEQDLTAGKFRRSPNPVAGQYIVVLGEQPPATHGPEEASKDGDKSGSTDAPIGTIATELTGKYGGKVKELYYYALRGFSVYMKVEEAMALSQDGRVLYVQEDARTNAPVVRCPGPASAEKSEAKKVESVGSWGLDRIDQRALPLNQSYTYPNTASDVDVYVIDTGIRPTHQEFGGRAFAAYDAIGDGRNGIDCHGHGTHVAGTVGGTTYGVAKEATIYGVRVLDCDGFGNDSDIIEGIDWVTGNHNPNRPSVVNVSLGRYSETDTAVDAAVRNSIGHGLTYALAAGNSNDDASRYTPAHVQEGLTVGATKINDVRWIRDAENGSNYGSTLDLFAPGVDIRSAWHESDTQTCVIGGTSMASPHVAGVAAMYLQENPNATPAQVNSAVINAATTGVVGSPGSGSPNRLLYAHFNAPPPPPPSPTPTPIPTPTPPPSPSGNNAEFVSQSVPTTMQEDDYYDVSVTMRNTGTTTWNPGGNNPYRLGSQNPENNTLWHNGRVDLPSAVSPGAEVTFDFTVRAPSAGTYNFQWKMLTEYAEWFGAQTPNVVVNVVSAPPTPTPTPVIYDGFHESADCQRIVGWAWNRTLPNTPINVDIFDNNVLLATVPANIFRQDLLNAGIGNGAHGFDFPVPQALRDGNSHSIRVKISATNFTLHDSPRTITCAPPPPVNNAAFVSQTPPPASLNGGQSFAVSVTMRNTGTTTWTTANGYKLGSQNPPNNTTWGFSRVALPHTVAPGASVTFNFTITAPVAAGDYNFQWRMIREGVEWFGDTTPNVVVCVRQFSRDLFAVRKYNTGSGSTEVHLLSASSLFQQFSLHAATPLAQTSNNWEFISADWDRDGRSDLVAIKKFQTGSTLEVHILSAASNFQQWILHAATALEQTVDKYDFAMADWNRDGVLDLVAIKKYDTGTSAVELHVMSGAGATPFRQFILQRGTTFNADLSITRDCQFTVADWDRDGVQDLVAIRRRGTPSQRTVVHILTGASQYTHWTVSTPTPLEEAGDNFAFTLTDWEQDGLPDLVAVKKSGTGTGMTEVHILSGASNFQQFTLHIGTALHSTGPDFAFTMGRFAP